ncbi:hypothetical protein V7087_00215 [Neobacillus niacini]|uniref:hypothetical protein n=1 Tax=Neobacillus niacini TaxID=86668 RepID=UPI002FFF56CD
MKHFKRVQSLHKELEFGAINPHDFMQRDIGKLTSAAVLEDGPIYSRIELGYQLQGTNASSLILTA